MKKKNRDAPVKKYRERTAFRMKKKRHVERPRSPPVGERQALRKRIVLSNPNALEVKDMKDLSADTMIEARLRGSVLGLPMQMLDQLRASGAFKPHQGWAIFRRPGTVMRNETLEMGKNFHEITSDGAGKGKVFKRIISGVRASGKTVHLLQAMTMAFAKKWVVFTVPEGKLMVCSWDCPFADCFKSPGFGYWPYYLHPDFWHRSNFVRSSRCHRRSAVPCNQF